MMNERLQFRFLKQDNGQIVDLLRLAIGYPTPEKIKKVMATYSSSTYHLLGAMRESELIGIVGVEEKEKCLIIGHIAIKESYQRQGVGKALIEELIKEFSPSKIIAETDQDAVEFYRKCGFICRQVQGQFPGRQLCERCLDNMMRTLDE